MFWPQKPCEIGRLLGPEVGDEETGRELSAGLGVAVRVHLAVVPVPEEVLSSGERRQLRALPTEDRRRDWLLARAALKALLTGESDTSVLSFPHPRLSLTHAGGVAFAIAAGAAHEVAGAGVDHEPWRATQPGMARFFLRPRERATVLGRLRAWTAKEALYKAVPANQDVTLLDIELDDPGSASGTATGPRGERLRYSVVDTVGGPLAAAVCLRSGRVAV